MEHLLNVKKLAQSAFKDKYRLVEYKRILDMFNGAEGRVTKAEIARIKDLLKKDHQEVLSHLTKMNKTAIK